MNALIHEFADDPAVRLIAGLILLDFVLGIAAAAKVGTFRLGWVSDFLRADVLGKVVPFFAVWAAVRVSGDIELAGFGMIEEGVAAAVVISLGASVLNSLRDLGLHSAPDSVAGSDTPPPQP